MNLKWKRSDTQQWWGARIEDGRVVACVFGQQDGWRFRWSLTGPARAVMTTRGGCTEGWCANLDAALAQATRSAWLAMAPAPE